MLLKIAYRTTFCVLGLDDTAVVELYVERSACRQCVDVSARRPCTAVVWVIGANEHLLHNQMNDKPKHTKYENKIMQMANSRGATTPGRLSLLPSAGR